ncbi:MAG: hypothetical protein WCF18_19240 [Chthoniobacteraceae bacterium]
MKSPIPFRLTLLALLALILPAKSLAEISLALKSEPGDWIGGGKNYFFPQSAGTFTVEKTYRNGVYAAFATASYGQSWFLYFGAPGDALLQRGAYVEATRFAFHQPGEPGLDVYGNGSGSNQLSGSFVVKDIAYGPNNTIERFWVVFEQHSENATAALRGEVRYNVDVTTQVSGPIGKVVDFDHDLDFTVSATDSGNRALTLTAANLPLGATFTDLGNNTGKFHWRPSLSQSAATYNVTFSADNGVGATDRTITAIEVRGTTRLTVTSGLDDPIGGGRNYDFGPADGTFYVTQWDSYDNRLYVQFNRPDYSESWNLSFIRPTGSPELTEGVYLGSGWNPATLDVTRGSSYFGSKFGNFQIKEIVIEGSKVRRFWATFEQYAGSARGLLKGEIKFNIPSASDVAAPIAAAVTAGATLDVPISAVGGTNAIFALSASDLPPGAILTDRGDNTGLLHWPTSAGDVGVHHVTFRAEDAGGVVRSTPTAIDVKGITALKVQQSTNGFATITNSYELNESAGAFRLTKNAGDGISITYQPDTDYYYSWALDFAAAGKTRLSPGLYRGAMPSLPSDTAPTLVVHQPSGYSYGSSGTFEIKEIAYGPDEALTKFRATFEQDNVGTPDLRGEINFNATGGPRILAPLQRAVRFGTAVDFEVTASDSSSGSLALSAMNLPAGAAFTDRGDGTGHFHWATGVGDKGSRTVAFKVTTGGGTSDTASTAIDVNGVMALTMNSQQGDVVGLGKDYSFGPNDGRFTATKNENNGVMTVSFASDDPSTSWILYFSAPGNVPLTAGSYPNATSTALYGQASTSPGLLVRGGSYFSFDTITGNFVIKEIVTAADGTIESFWATFEQHADGRSPALAGEIKFNVTAPVQFSNPAIVTTEYASGLDFNVSTFTTSGGGITLSTGALPQGATFTDHGDGTGTLHWQPSFAQIGNYSISFTARDAAGHTDISSTTIEVAGITSLVMESETGDYVGGGKSYSFPRNAGRFSASKYGAGGVTVSFVAGTNSWNLLFTAPPGSILGLGIYTGAEGGYDGIKPMLSVRGPSTSPYNQTGAFRIKQLEYGPNDTISSFWAVFEQHNAGADPALLGEIKYNVTAADNVSISAPFQARIQYSETIEFDVAARSSPPGPITLSAADLPAGSEFTDHGNGSATFRWTPGLGDPGVRTIAFTAKNAAGEMDTTSTAIEVRGLTFLAMQSDKGDYIGGGKTYFYPAASGSFSIATNYHSGINVSFNSDKEWWYLNFAAPGDAVLQPGTYSGAMRFPFQTAGSPGLDISGNGRGSNTLTGNFTVKQVVYGAGGTIESFWVLFEQHSEGALPGLTGEFRFNVWPTGGISAPFAQTVVRSRTLEFLVTAAAPDNAAFSLEAANLPTGATFTDHHNNTGTFRWDTNTARLGHYTVSFSAHSESGGAEPVTTQIEVQGVTSLAMESDLGDYVGQGKSYFFPETAGAFYIGRNYDNGVSLTFDGGSWSTTWRLDFAAPDSVRLVPGTYTGARRFPYQEGTEPGLHVIGYDRDPKELTGNFTVKQIVYGDDDTITNFWATFEQHAQGGGTLLGEIKFNAEAPEAPNIPSKGVFDVRQFKGTFRGMAGDRWSPYFASSGPVELTMTRNGVVTGKVRLGSQTYYFHGTVDAGGYGTFVGRSHDGLTSVAITLQANTRGDRLFFAGKVTGANGFSTTFTAGRTSPRPAEASLVGRYTFLLQPTSGDVVAEGGWGSIVVGKSGALRMVGTTADGRSFDATALPNEDGSWPMFFQPIFLAGNLNGVLTPADLTNSDISGPMQWFRPASVRGPYQAEVNAALTLEASRYVPANPALQLPHGLARVSFSGTQLTAFDEDVSAVANRSRLDVFGENPRRLSLTADGRNGSIRGSFRTTGNRAATVRGIINQKTNRAQGTFSDGHEIGAFTLLPE